MKRETTLIYVSGYTILVECDERGTEYARAMAAKWIDAHFPKNMEVSL